MLIAYRLRSMNVQSVCVREKRDSYVYKKGFCLSCCPTATIFMASNIFSVSHLKHLKWPLHPVGFERAAAFWNHRLRCVPVCECWDVPNTYIYMVFPHKRSYIIYKYIWMCTWSPRYVLKQLNRYSHCWGNWATPAIRLWSPEIPVIFPSWFHIDIIILNIDIYVHVCGSVQTWPMAILKWWRCITKPKTRLGTEPNVISINTDG